ncbi:flavin-containing monooxygenase, partial [Streptomyces sp. NPDC050538]|uniref:flavin-containing monooxygenase n=1 Tax=Streptomyces sp. NPDC050538 TaxID=3365627 RepID=UPI0037950ED7
MEQVDVLVVGGGQSGLAAAYALRQEGLEPVVLEASERAAGSWPRYYDSLTLFSPAAYSCLPAMPFGGDPDRYPHRDEVVAYLLRYADRLDADVRTRVRVRAVRFEGGIFTLSLEGGGRLGARAVVAASGTFGRPHHPGLPGLETCTGTVLHAADCRTPEPFAGQRVVVVGAGTSAVQIAAELAERARVTLVARHPVRFARQCTLGRDLDWWLTGTGLDVLPVGRFLCTPPARPVIDGGAYRAAGAPRGPGGPRTPGFAAVGGPKEPRATGCSVV